ncbi:hypothetical protein [Deinococcus aquaedulcis]|uniref:hypothetical protein n=1 Tax=Deinococcus aquaedulcis TaxID=2840455 RepID=UPI001C834269|nr:hypothetical protein [Deinococcus aquaedulcis]
MQEGPQARKRKRKPAGPDPAPAAAPEPLVPNLRDSRAPQPVPAPLSPRRVTLAALLPPGVDPLPALRRRARRRPRR